MHPEGPITVQYYAVYIDSLVTCARYRRRGVKALMHAVHVGDNHAKAELITRIHRTKD